MGGNFGAQMGVRLGGINTYLNLKKQFDDAVRQNEWKKQQAYMDNQAQMNRQKVSTAGSLAGSGYMSPDQFQQATAYTDPYTNQQVPGMQISSPESTPQRTMSPTLQNAKDKRTQDILTMIEDNNMHRDTLKNAYASASKISGGLYGKISRGFLKRVDPNSPALTDWQNVKMALTDAQLMQSLVLKGAISDRENKWLAEAAANDDISALPRIKPVLDRALRAVNAKEKGAITSYKRIYGEDPYSWQEGISNIDSVKFDNASSGKTSSGNTFQRVGD